MSSIKVPVKDEEGNEVLEDLKEGKKQSDGSMWNIPRPMGGEGHQHYFRMKPNDRVAKCECGIAGYVFPYNSRLIDGHIYKLDGTKVI